MRWKIWQKKKHIWRIMKHIFNANDIKHRQQAALYPFLLGNIKKNLKKDVPETPKIANMMFFSINNIKVLLLLAVRVSHVSVGEPSSHSSPSTPASSLSFMCHFGSALLILLLSEDSATAWWCLRKKYFSQELASAIIWLWGSSEMGLCRQINSLLWW